MNYRHIIIVALLAALCAGPSRADTGPGEEEQEAYIGIATSSLQPAMARHLKLPEGSGLVVNYVEPEGAANEVLRKDDILTSFEDQILVNAQQLAVLTRAKQPGETVKLELLRDGKAVGVKVKLGSRPNKDMGAGWALPDYPAYGTGRAQGRALTVPTPMPFVLKQHGMNPEDIQRFKDQAMKFKDEALKMKDNGHFQERLLELQRHADELKVLGDTLDQFGPHQLEIEAYGSQHPHRTISVIQNDLMITLTAVDGHEHVKAMKTDGTVLFDGPTDTEEERAGMPDEVKAWYDGLEDSPVPVKVRAKPNVS